MSVSITKQGIISAGGSGINENLILNSRCDSYTNWTRNTDFDIVEKDGYPCFHFEGALQTTKYTTMKHASTGAATFPVTYGETYILSAYVLFDNVVRGTTNYAVGLYRSGSTIDGTWRTATIEANSGHFLELSSNWFDETTLNDNGWTRAWIKFTYGDYEWPNQGYSLYARDFTGDVYYRNIKVEKADTITPWLPSTADDIYVSNESAFNEDYELASIHSDFITANEFIEY